MKSRRCCRIPSPSTGSPAFSMESQNRQTTADIFTTPCENTDPSHLTGRLSLAFQRRRRMTPNARRFRRIRRCARTATIWSAAARRILRKVRASPSIIGVKSGQRTLSDSEWREKRTKQSPASSDAELASSADDCGDRAVNAKDENVPPPSPNPGGFWARAVCAVQGILSVVRADAQ